MILVRCSKVCAEARSRSSANVGTQGAKPHQPPAKTAGLPNEGRRMRSEGTPRPDRPSVDRAVRGPEDVRVWMLGAFRISVGSGRTIEQGEWRLRKAANLVKLLALAPGHRLHREQAMALLWPDSGKRAASNNLRQVLYGARRILDPASGSPERYLTLRDEQIALCPDGQLWVDVDAFEEAAATARRSRDPAAYRAAIDLYSGELLPEDRYEEWAEGRREQLRQLYLALIAELASLYEGRGEYASAIEALVMVTSEEPTLEEAHASLMRLYARSKRPERVLAQYERLREALRKSTGTQPAEATRRLRDEIATGRLPPSSRVDLTRGASSNGAKHNLPAPMSSFVGREREMVEVKRTLAMTRLLTLTGAGGSGKTRLSLEVARDLVGSYPDGVWFVELAPLSDDGLVTQEVANVLGVQERPGEPLADALVEALSAKEMLLVIDNCEHLVEEAARLVDRLLASCPHLKVLVTSREPLAVSGEVNWSVPPLSLPDAANGGVDVGALMRYEAVRLFIDRARLRLLDFEVTRENAGAVTRVCRKLEGIPLAIELATARMGALAVEQVAQRLETSLDVLKGTSRSVAPRQQTLRATLDWSHDLLSDDERTFFGRLSVFAGGWTLEAAEAVCSGDAIGRDEVLDLLGGLVDKSLVVAGAGTEGTVRYRMLEPIRQYSGQKLDESGEVGTVQDCHAEYFLALAEEAEPHLVGPQEQRWLESLEEEHDNIRKVFSWSFGHGDPELGLRLAGAVWWFWYRQGRYREGRKRLREALTKASEAPPSARVKALGGIGWLAYELGDLDQMREATTRALSIIDEARLPGEQKVFSLNLLGDASRLEGDLQRAAQLAEEGLSLSRKAGNLQSTLHSLLVRGNSSDLPGNLDETRAFYEEGLTLSRQLGSAYWRGVFLSSLGITFLFAGDYERATALFEEKKSELTRRRRANSDLADSNDNLGWAALFSGDLARAKVLHEESLALFQELSDKRGTSDCLQGLACAAGSEGEPSRAAKLFGAAQALRETMGISRTLAENASEEPYLVRARSRLDEASWETAFAKGKAMTTQRAVEYALNEEETGPSASPASPVPPNDEPVGSLTRREREVAPSSPVASPTAR
jgi:predicted ATPase/DNA-binding SARP family transcriptional activator